MISADQNSTSIWAGIDLSKDTITIALDHPFHLTNQLPALLDLPVREFPRTAAAIPAIMEWLAAQAAVHGMEADQVRIVMESTGGLCQEFVRWLLEQAPSTMPAIVNASAMAAFAKSQLTRGKTDKADARIIARYGTFHRPGPCELLSETRQQLRELVRLREFYIQQRTALKNRSQAPLADDVTRKSLKKFIEHYNREIKRLDKSLIKLYKKDEPLARDIALLKTIKGVGEVTAVTVIAEVGDMRRFARARQLSAFVGLSPRHTQSGSSIDKKGGITKIGNAGPRRVLLLAVWSAINKPGPFQDLYRKYLERGKGKLCAQVALMRKLIVLMRAMVISGKPFDPKRL